MHKQNPPDPLKFSSLKKAVGDLDGVLLGVVPINLVGASERQAYVIIWEGVAVRTSGLEELDGGLHDRDPGGVGVDTCLGRGEDSAGGEDVLAVGARIPPQIIDNLQENADYQ